MEIWTISANSAARWSRNSSNGAASGMNAFWTLFSTHPATNLCRPITNTWPLPTVLCPPAAKAIHDIGYQNVHILQGDGSQGLPDEAPFNAILITAAAPDIPPPLISQLALGGRVIAPVGGQHHQTLVCWTKNSENRIEKDELIPVVFVPLRGKHGWLDEDWPE